MGIRQLLITTAVTGILMIALNNFLKKLSNERILKIKKKRGLDTLGINKILTFGIPNEVCPGHFETDFDCGKIECVFGKLRYLLSFIENSCNSIDLCVCIISGEDFGKSIINAFKRGVRIRIIVDSDIGVLSSPIVAEFIRLNIPLRQEKSDYMMHHKFLIIDKSLLITGSMNLTMSAVFNNLESVMITSQPVLVNSFQKCFDDLWEDFSPKNVYARLQAKRNAEQEK